MPVTQSDHLVYTLNEWSRPPFTDYLTYIFNDLSVKNFVDIGANVGGVIEVLNRRNLIKRLDKVICFEPDTDNYTYLTSLCDGISKKNNINIVCYNTGIYYGKTESIVCGAGDNNVGGYFLADEDITTTRPFKVYPYDKVFKLDTLENYIDHSIDIVKIDIEGSELNILEHSDLLKKCKYMILEWHFTMEKFNEFFQKHLALYYDVIKRDPHINHFILKSK